MHVQYYARRYHLISTLVVTAQFEDVLSKKHPPFTNLHRPKPQPPPKNNLFLSVHGRTRTVTVKIDRQKSDFESSSYS